MADLLIAPSAAQLLPRAEPRPAAEPAAAPPGAGNSGPAEANGAVAAGAAPPANDPPAAEPTAGAASASFAAVLKKQMSAPANAAAVADPLLLAAKAPAEADVVAEDLSALLPFIEALLPKLVAKSAEADSSAAEDAGTAAGAEAAKLMTAVDPVTPAMPATATPAVSTATPSAAPAIEGEPEHRRTAGGGLPVATAAAGPAISADEAAPDASPALLAAADKDFAGLVARAGEGLAAAQPATASHRPAEAVPLRMETPAGQSAWSNELGNKLTWMATAQRQQADLVLNPPQLGRVEISLTVTGDQASAVFASPNAAVRELLEDSLPRLREILSGAGINLGEAHVGSESRSQFGEGQRSDNPGTLVNGGNVAETAPIGLVAARPVQAGRGMVDVFA